MNPWIVIDFETASACDLKKSGAYRYSVDPTTEILCLSFEDHRGQRGTWWPGTPEMTASEIVLRQALNDPRMIWVCHNSGFERNIWTHHMHEIFGWDDIPLSNWHDTQARGCQLVLPAKLEQILRALRLPQEKDLEGNRLTLSLSRADKKTGRYPERTQAVMHRVGLYCESDIGGQVALHRRIGWLPAHERPIWELSQRMNDRGILLDMELVRAMQAVVDEASGPLAARFKEITGGLTFGQIAKVKAWVLAQGVDVPNLAKDTLAALLGDGEESDEWETGEDEGEDDVHDVELPVAVREALHIRQLIGSASIKKLKSMEACVGYDGRARGLLRYHGTGPGRQAGLLLQPHNFPKGTLGQDAKADIDGLVAALKSRDLAEVERVGGKPPVEVVVSTLRHCIIASPGKKLCAGDYAGIQARTVLAISGQWDKVALMAAGADVYCDMAGQIYHRVITKADEKERGIGKNSVLGLGFQMGDKTFRLKYAKEHPLEFCTGVVKTYREDWAPEVPKTWKGLQQAAIDTVWYGIPHTYGVVTYRLEDEWLTAHIQGMPDDCKLWYYNPQKVTRLMPWSTPESPDYRKGFTYQVQKGGMWLTRDAFGGQLTENVVMKIERELMEHAKPKLEAAGYDLVLEVHDEIVGEGDDPERFKAIMEDVPDWCHALRIPVAVEAWASERYKK